jgi:hypothetical protein
MTSSTANHPIADWYRYVGSVIDRLIPAFDLETSRETIERAYAITCGQSLAYPLSDVRCVSRINDDGTPFQFSVAFGAFEPALQFLSEAGATTGADRDRISRECIRELADLLQCRTDLDECMPLIDRLAPADAVDLATDPGGAFWIGIAWRRQRAPKLKVYVNASWGSEESQWSRLSALTAFFDAAARWAEIQPTVAGTMRPLGAAITLDADGAPEGRIYLRAYGQRVSYYEGLARAHAEPAFVGALEAYARAILADGYDYPTLSAVCSFGLGPDAGRDFKFELCGHCAFSSDAEARSRCEDWMQRLGVDGGAYRRLLAAVSTRPLSADRVNLHGFTGLGWKRGNPYCTVYVKPFPS